jgi:hypothetical protein
VGVDKIDWFPLPFIPSRQGRGDFWWISLGSGFCIFILRLFLGLEFRIYHEGSHPCR